MLLKVNELETHFKIGEKVIKAVNGITFNLKKGEILGLIGESGCGKSTVALSLLRLIKYPGIINSGEILLNGQDLLKLNEEEMRKKRWKEISFIPQSAMNALNPVHQVGDQIVEAIMVHENEKREKAILRCKELLNLVGIDPERYKSYPHEFSGGMKQRVVIAMSLACSPQVLVADESVTGLDVLTQAQILGLIKDLQEELGLSIIFISHDLTTVLDICDRVVIMYAGEIFEISLSEKIREQALHPYTQGLLRATPDLKDLDRICESIPGQVPDLSALPPGCSFFPRCQEGEKICREKSPLLREVGNWSKVACWKREE